MITYDELMNKRFLGDWVLDSSLKEDHLVELLSAITRTPNEFSFTIEDIKQALLDRNLSPDIVGMTLYYLEYKKEKE